MNKYGRIINNLKCKIEVLKINQSYASCPECVDKDIEDMEKIVNALEKLTKAIQILNRIYGFLLQDKKCSGYYELLIPDMTSDELTKEEYELLKEVLDE